MQVPKSIVAAAVPMFLCAPVVGNTFGTDITDIWWNAAESGWGVNVIHQDDTLFITFFVYAPDGRPNWYVAPATTWVSTGTYRGAVYRTTGPWFGTFFNPNSVVTTVAGTATFNIQFINQATLTYLIDGTTVSKSLTRQTWRVNDLTGSYTGAIRQQQSGCLFPNPTGTFVVPVNVSVSHFGTSFTMTSTENSGARCTYVGTHRQEGRLGAVNNVSFSCTSGSIGTASLFDIEASTSSISGRFTAASNTCATISGRFSAVRN